MRMPPIVSGPSISCGIELRDAAAHPLEAVEHVEERPANRVPRLRVRVARDRTALQRVEAAHIVEAEDVVRVRVREEDRVDARDPVRKRLLAQVGRGVDEDPRAIGHVDVDRRAQPAIARVGGSAGRARAADHRHAVRRAGAEHRDPALQGVMMRDCGFWASMNRRRSS